MDAMEKVLRSARHVKIACALFILWALVVGVSVAFGADASDSLAIEAKPYANSLEETRPLVVWDSTDFITGDTLIVGGTGDDTSAAYWTFKNTLLVFDVSGTTVDLVLQVWAGRVETGNFQVVLADSDTVVTAGTHVWDLSGLSLYEHFYFRVYGRGSNSADVRLFDGWVIRRRY